MAVQVLKGFYLLTQYICSSWIMEMFLHISLYWERREQLKLYCYLTKTSLILYLQYSECLLYFNSCFHFTPAKCSPSFWTIPSCSCHSFFINWLLARLPEVYFNSHYISSESDLRRMSPASNIVNSLQIIFQQMFIAYCDPVMALGPGDTVMNKVSACKGSPFLVMWWQ